MHSACVCPEYDTCDKMTDVTPVRSTASCIDIVKDVQLLPDSETKRSG